MVTDEEGKKHKTYYYKVPEAKIILSDSIIISPWNRVYRK